MKIQSVLKFSEKGSLILSPLRAETDAPDLFEAAKPLAETFRFRTGPKDATYQAFSEWLKRLETEPTRFSWTIRLAENGTAVGEVNLFDMLRYPSVALWVGANWRDTPVFLETMLLIFEEAFVRRNLHRLQFTYNADNHRLRRVMERLPFPDEGRLREAFDNRDGTYSDVIVTGILRKEWARAFGNETKSSVTSIRDGSFGR
jgi:RimJ/RimL family protein N-acetyltransferase